MAKLSRMRAFGWLAAITLACIIGLSTFRDASAQGPVYVDGTVQFSDLSLCWYYSTFFDKWVFPSIVEIDAAGTVIGPGYANGANHLGLFSIPITPTVAPTRIRITCESLVFEHTLTPAEISTESMKLVLPNRKPVAANLVAGLNGQTVTAAPAGSTLTVSVLAIDPDGDPLNYQWRAAAGTAANTNSAQTTWTLPNSRGLHFLYVLVSDSKGGYEEEQIAMSTDDGMVPGPQRIFSPIITKWGTPPSPPVRQLKPSDRVPSGNHFLTYSALTHFSLAPAESMGGPQDNQASACAYYRDIGVVGGCTASGVPTGQQLTFQQWKTYWGFGSAANEASAKYANKADLNLQRDMHTLSKPGPRPGGGTGTDVASYVCNYPNPPDDVTLSNVRLGNNLVACVSFEFSVTQNPLTGAYYNSGLPFTKFITFGPDGNLLLSVNLDGRGEKYIPGACVACHGGSNYDGQYGAFGSPDPALRAQFIPYDLGNYQFSTLPGFGRADQEAALRALNLFVLDTSPYTVTVDLINGWYPTNTSAFNGAYTPAGWVGHEALYHDVFAPQCRMCHVALDPTYLTFDTYTSFAAEKNIIARRVCGGTGIERYWYSMPNAKETFDRFWLSIGGTPGVDQPARLLEFLIAENTLDSFGNPITKCELPAWLVP